MKRWMSALLILALFIGAQGTVLAENKTFSSADVTGQSTEGVAVYGDRITKWDAGGWVSFPAVDFTGVKSVRIKANIVYMLGDNGEAFRLYLDDPLKGECIGYIVVNEELEEPVYYGTNIDAVSGVHTLYLKQNYTHTDHLSVYEVVLSDAEWNDPKRVSPVPDSAIIDTFADTWTAVDQAGHKIADFEEVGPVKDGLHDICLFYHDWHVHNTQAYIASEVIAKYPEAKDEYYHSAWPINGPAWWAEPVYGFYTGMDYWHYRKAAELLADAGVDAVFLDYTNSDAAYIKALNVMLRAYHDSRALGVDVPKISCYMQMGTQANYNFLMLKAVYFNMFYNEDYSDLWYYMDGKPMLIQYSPEGTRNMANAADKAEVALAEHMYNMFTFRETGNRELGDVDNTGKYWHWLVNYPQHEWGKTADGRVECVNLAMAINHSYVYGYTGVGVFSDKFTKGKNYTEAFGEDYRPEAIHEGYFFREQASKVLEVDPAHVFVDGWNEWNTARGRDYYGFPNAFIDLFDDENSRDFEPSKSVVKDDYYNLLVDFIRKYKGVRPAPVASEPITIDLAGGDAQWDTVAPEFINYYGGYERNALGYKKYGTNENYVYTTEVKNAISRAKVARDAENFYFYVLCEENVKTGHAGCLNLYINVDRNYATGWEGYDYLVHDGKLSRFADGAYTLTDVAAVEQAVSGRSMTVKIPRALIGETGLAELEFKWTDNILPEGDLLLFYTEGSAAPVGRYNYLYTEIAQTALTSDQRSALSDTTVVKAGAQKMIVAGGKMNVYDKDIRITPFEAEGTLYLPAAAVEELMGYGKTKVVYDYKKNVLTIKTHDLENNEITNFQWIYTTVGSFDMRIDGEYALLSAEVKAQDGVVYVPVSLLAEGFGWDVVSLGDGAYALSKHTANIDAARSVLSHLS